jgi:hypothetical protein
MIVLQMDESSQQVADADAEEGYGDYDPFGGMHGSDADVAVLEDGEASAIWCDEAIEDR